MLLAKIVNKKAQFGWKIVDFQMFLTECFDDEPICLRIKA